MIWLESIPHLKFFLLDKPNRPFKCLCMLKRVSIVDACDMSCRSIHFNAKVNLLRFLRWFAWVSIVLKSLLAIKRQIVVKTLIDPHQTRQGEKFQWTFIYCGRTSLPGAVGQCTVCWMGENIWCGMHALALLPLLQALVPSPSKHIVDPDSATAIYLQGSFPWRSTPLLVMGPLWGGGSSKPHLLVIMHAVVTLSSLYPHLVLSCSTALIPSCLYIQVPISM